MAVALQKISAEKPPPHDFLIQLWKRTAGRLQNRGRSIVDCRNFRRGLMRVPIPKDWSSDNPEIRNWLSVCLPERQLLDLNLSNVLGERTPELSRVPLGTTPQAVEDGDQLEVYAQSAFDAAADLDAVIGLLVQDGEFAAIVTPSRAGPEECPEYTREFDTDKQAGKSKLKVRKPDPTYDRDTDGNAPDSKKTYKGRDEKKSRAAYDEARLRWMAEHPLWNVRLVNATDCAPLMVRGRGKKRLECKGLLVRTLYDREELLHQGFSWKSMGDDVLIPLDFDAGRTYGNGGQIYLYEAYLMVSDEKHPGREKPICVYSVGGESTWERGEDGNDRAAIIDLSKEFGLTARCWDYFYGLHFEEDPDWRGVPFIKPLLETMKSHETTRAAIRAAMWDTSFTGHIEVPDPRMPPELILEGFKSQFKTTKRPGPGQTTKALGAVTPYIQAQVGADAYRMMEMDKRDIDLNTPDSATVGGGDAAARSGHALVVGEKLLRTGKRQIGRGVLDFTEFVTEQILRIGVAAMEGAGNQPKLEAPVFVTVEEQLDDGDIREKTSVMQLNPRWVGGQYHLKASFPEEGNAVAVEQMANLAERGFATDEDVDKARGIKNSTWARVQRDIFQWRKSPEGRLEIAQRAAQYQGNQARIKLLRLVAEGMATPGGGPTAAIDPNMPGTAAMGAMGGGMMQGGGGGQMPPQGMGGGGPTTAQQQLGGELATGKAPAMNDARALQQIGA